MTNLTENPRSARSVAEFAAVYGLGVATVWRQIASGKLIALKAGRRTLIPNESELAWLSSLPRAGFRSAA